VTTVQCPEGHASTATDYCDVCGAPIGATPTAPPAAAAPSAAAAPAGTDKDCPNCGSANAGAALFCEDCGYDFTTGALPPPVPTGGPDLVIPPTPPPPATGPVEWVAEVWVDPDWYATQDSDDPCPSAGTPVTVALRDRTNLVGRRSRSKAIFPVIDCGTDSGVSRRHAQLTTDGTRWWVEDLQSANGTFVGASGAPLPLDPIAPGPRRELGDNDRVYVGAWTRIVVRAATADEQTL
jgi:hypothetical protein